MDQILDYIEYIAIATSLVAIVCVLLLIPAVRRLHNKSSNSVAELNQKLSKAQQSLKAHEEKLHEIQSALYGMSAKLKSLENIEFPEGVTPSEFQALQNEVSLLISKVKAIETADPGSKLYTKAAKLVASGATLEEVMQECELPRAEAELLMSLHTAKN